MATRSPASTPRLLSTGKLSLALLGHRNTRSRTIVSDVQQCRGETEENKTNGGSKIKLGQPRVQMSGPLAGLVQERLRQRREL